MVNTIYTMDALEFLQNKKNIDVIITSIPDFSEMNMSLEDWIFFLDKTINLIIKSLSENGIAFFYQTDRKYNGQIIDKKSLITKYFQENGYNTIFSKIVLKQSPETINLYRPTFSNLFGFSKKIKTSKATPDVIFQGKMLYNNAMGYNACNSCIDFLKFKNINKTIVDPFCGQGSILKIAKDNGFNYIGCDIDKNQTSIAIKNLNSLF